MMLALLTMALLVVEPAQPVASPAAVDLAPDARELVVMPTPADQATRDKIISAVEVWTWDTSLMVGRATARERELLATLGVQALVVEDPGDRPLFLVGLRSEEERDALASVAAVHAVVGLSALVSPKAAQTKVDLERAIVATLGEAGGRRLHSGLVAVPRTKASPSRGRAPLLGPPEWNPHVQALVDQVSGTTIEAWIDHLSNAYTTRVAFLPEAFAARNWLMTTFQGFGNLFVTAHDYNSDSDNVIAELAGVKNPERLVIVGAHYDSLNYHDYPNGRAPGADDNASGTAAVLELARVFSQAQFKNTIRFVAFCSEEMGLVGSRAYAALLASQGADVLVMLNTDMNAYRAAEDVRSLDFVENYSAEWLIDRCEELTALYVPGLPTNRGELWGGTSDHQSFDEQGYDAIFFFEDLSNYSPYIHTADDTLGLSANDMVRSEAITKSVAAALAYFADPIDLEIRHVPLSDQEGSSDPYVVRAEASSLVGSTVTSMTLHYAPGGTTIEVPMLPSGNPLEWIAQIPPQPAGTSVDYYLLAVDDQGAKEWFPDGMTEGEKRLNFLVGVQQIILEDDFEVASGWTHGGVFDDWLRTPPRGRWEDPTRAYSGLCVWGNDTGYYYTDGRYVENANNWLESVPLNTVGLFGTRLRYWRHLAVEDGLHDHARIMVNGSVVWQNSSGGGTDHHIDKDWTLHDIDVSVQADNQPAVTIRFELESDRTHRFGGWNIDLLELLAFQPAPTPELSRDTAFVSLSTGGTVNYRIEFGSGYAGRRYLLLAGSSGSEPGFDLGGTHVPLNFDATTLLFLQLASALPGWTGTLDAAGCASASLPVTPLDPSLSGVTLSFVAITLQPTTDNASNAVDVLLIP
ncbi:MAG: M20/M25/M40 family metallo-hydrolase [Planctomycetota bacterium]